MLAYQLREYRRRAFDLLLDKLDKSTPMLVDYQIDAALRNLLDLPELPDNSQPYIGWMTPFSSSSTTHLHISQTGIDLIKEFEGFRSNAYLCPGNIWTIGYGHTATAKAGMTISKLQAEALLVEDVKKFQTLVNQKVRVRLNQNQFDALVSFAFNVGARGFGNSTLRRLLNQGEYSQAAKEFHRWVYAKGTKLPGLVRRRQAEYDLFTTP